MIVEWLWGLWVHAASAAVSTVPSFDQSTTNAGLMGMLAPVINGASGLGAWIPWTTLGVVAPLTISFYLGALLVRAVKSLVPFISG